MPVNGHTGSRIDGFDGVHYAFNWGDELLAYRYLYYDQKCDKLVQNFSFTSPRDDFSILSLGDKGVTGLPYIL